MSVEFDSSYFAYFIFSFTYSYTVMVIIPLDMRAITLITVIFMDHANSQYPDCVDVTCPDGE